MRNVVIILICLVILPTITYAGDIPESLMQGEQQALFIGKIVKKDAETYIIKPTTVMMGSVAQEKIKVGKFKYCGTSDIPEIEDYVVVVLLEENKIDDSWIFKATSGNFEKLELVSKKYNYSMVDRYQEYMNKGKYFEAQKKLDKMKNEEVDTVKNKEEKNKSNKDSNNNSVSRNRKLKRNILIYIAICVSIYIFKTKKRFLGWVEKKLFKK